MQAVLEIQLAPSVLTTLLASLRQAVVVMHPDAPELISGIEPPGQPVQVLVARLRNGLAPEQVIANSQVPVAMGASSPSGHVARQESRAMLLIRVTPEQVSQSPAPVAT